MTAQTILPANSASGGFEVANSLRFNRGSSDYLSRATNVTGTNTKFTLSFWIKLCDIANFQRIFEVYKASNERVDCGFNLDNAGEPRFFIQEYTGSYIYRKIFTRLSRDVAAWTHYVIKFDSSEGEANRLRVYINGVEETATDQANLPADGATSIISVGTQHIGYSQNNSGHHLNGYLAEFVLIEGTDYDPTSFGEFDEDSGIWKPIDVSGLTFGTNGFYLEFKGSGTSANSSGMGADTSGNDHHFTVNNLTAVDQSTDTCTNNFATLNPLDNFFGENTLSEGNLKLASSTSTGHDAASRATIGVASGKWFWEVKVTSNSGGSNIGVMGDVETEDGQNCGHTNYAYAYKHDGNAVTGDENITSSTNPAFNGATYGDGDIIGVALNLDDNNIIWYKNGAVQNSGTGITVRAVETTPRGFYFPASSDNTENSSTSTHEYNFGSPAFAISSGNADGNGHGNFEYTVPSGYFALNTKNLAEHG